MAIFGKKQTDEATVKPEAANETAAAKVPAAPAETRGEGENDGSRLIVGSNVRLSGSEIADCDTVIIEGRVEATVDGRVMRITETGVFSGTVAIDMAEIRGQFHGELSVRKRLTVCGTGKVKGKIRYGALVVEEGGELSGDVDSLGTSQTAAPAKPAAVAVKEPAGPNRPEVVHPPRGLVS